MVTFRISCEEYELLANARMTSGSRSVSSFARSAVFDKIQMLAAPRVTLSGDLTTLGNALGQLDTSLRETSKRIRRLLGPANIDHGRAATDRM